MNLKNKLQLSYAGKIFPIEISNAVLMQKHINIPIAKYFP